jgi:hypothetical protein
MEKRKCPVLVNGKECGLALTLVEREFETATAVYECPLGHRTHVLAGELGQRKCPVLVNGKECGLTLTLVEREFETATAVYECPLGHRSYVPLEPEAVDSS